MSEHTPSSATPPPAYANGGMQADEITRVRLGASPDSPHDLLQWLAADPAVTVRAAVAMNTAAPADADRLLAGDGDERIRSMLARKLAAMLPSLRTADSEAPQHHALPVLAALVTDDAVRVRATITDVVKEMPEAPHNLILRLAQDSAVPVSYPVIRLSPQLTADDLLALLATPPNRATATAVAARAGLNATLCDAVAASADAAAIAALLANHSATIRPATLDALSAARRPDWQALMADRPASSASLSEFLVPRKAVRTPTMDEAMWEARKLANSGGLDEAALLGAVERGETCMATALLAVAADVSCTMVDRAVTLHNAKALVSLVWRAGFSMKVAVPLQTELAHTPPGSVLRAGPNGAFPLAEEEMCWQVTLLKNMVR